MAHVFVYGTLMRGGTNHHVLADLGARFVAAARTAAPRTVVDLGPYPALLPSDAARDAGATPIPGELFEIADDEIAALDDFEGVPDLYRRERILIAMETCTMEAWVYVFSRGDR